MSSSSFISEQKGGPLLDQPRWYAIQAHARHEKKVAAALEYKGIAHYVPTVKEAHSWSDRRKIVEVPLFPCYVFVHFIPHAATRLSVLCIRGVLSFVPAHSLGLPIPDEQIAAVRSVLDHQISLTPYPFVKIGQRVRIRGGALDGMEGILVERNSGGRLVISIDSIERSLAISLQGYDVEPV